MAKKRLQARQNPKTGFFELTAGEPIELDALEAELDGALRVVSEANTKVRAVRNAPSEAQTELLGDLVAEGKVDADEAARAKTGRQVSRLISLHSDGGKERRQRALEAAAKGGLRLAADGDDGDDDD